MLNRTRKFIILSVAAALAVANAFAPRHVQAEAGQYAQKITTAAHDMHGAEVVSNNVAASPLCHDKGKIGGLAGAPDHNCCIASCSAIAFIFSSHAVERAIPKADYSAQLARTMIPALQNATDPPPR